MRAPIEKRLDLGKDVADNGQAVCLITPNRGKESIVPDDVNTLTDDELSTGSSSPLSLSLAKDTRGSTKAKSHKRPLQHPTSNYSVSVPSRKARKGASRRKNQPVQAPRNVLVLLEGEKPPVCPQA